MQKSSQTAGFLYLFKTIFTPFHRRGVALSAVGAVAEPHHLHHLAHAVADAVAVSLGDVGWSHVGGDERGQRAVVAYLEQVAHRGGHVAELHHLARLRAQVVDGEQRCARHVVPFGDRRAVHLGERHSVVERHPHALSRHGVSEVEGVYEALQGSQKRGLAVAVSARQQQAVARRGVDRPCRRLPHALLEVAVGRDAVSAAFHLRRHRHCEAALGILLAHGKPKTGHHRHPSHQLELQLVVDSHRSLV